ncbi:hypothetical protein ABW20_dc0108595 [Dactylellina cionopaga]|nr:hypothetical protein ABW20_dc0108595 [Dactylellina cionopaga]
MFVSCKHGCYYSKRSKRQLEREVLHAFEHFKGQWPDCSDFDNWRKNPSRWSRQPEPEEEQHQSEDADKEVGDDKENQAVSSHLEQVLYHTSSACPAGGFDGGYDEDSDDSDTPKPERSGPTVPQLQDTMDDRNETVAARSPVFNIADPLRVVSRSSPNFDIFSGRAQLGSLNQFATQDQNSNAKSRVSAGSIDDVIHLGDNAGLQASEKAVVSRAPTRVCIKDLPPRGFFSSSSRESASERNLAPPQKKLFGNRQPQAPQSRRVVSLGAQPGPSISVIQPAPVNHDQGPYDGYQTRDLAKSEKELKEIVWNELKKRNPQLQGGLTMTEFNNIMKSTLVGYAKDLGYSGDRYFASHPGSPGGYTARMCSCSSADRSNSVLSTPFHRPAGHPPFFHNPVPNRNRHPNPPIETLPPAPTLYVLKMPNTPAYLPITLTEIRRIIPSFEVPHIVIPLRWYPATLFNGQVQNFRAEQFLHLEIQATEALIGHQLSRLTNQDTSNTGATQNDTGGGGGGAVKRRSAYGYDGTCSPGRYVPSVVGIGTEQLQGSGIDTMSDPDELGYNMQLLFIN